MPESRPGQKVDANPDSRLDVDLLAIGKKVGLSFGEMNELRVVDLLDLARSYTGSKQDAPRDATQHDIDAFYGR